MSVELHLPDLPDVPIVVGAEPGTPPRPPQPWPSRLREVLAAYLPLLLMTLVALGSWWLVKNAPAPVATPADRPARLEPDYTMRTFTLQRFTPDGQLQARVEGSELRHYPVDDRIEVDRVEIRAVAPDGRVMRASARQAVGNGAATELALTGGAEVTANDTDGTPVAIRSEFLQASLDSDTVRTHLPVDVQRGHDVVTARGGLLYEHQRRFITLNGPLRSVLPARGR